MGGTRWKGARSRRATSRAKTVSIFQLNFIRRNIMKRSILMLAHDDDDGYITQPVFDENLYSLKLHLVNSSDELFAFLLSCEKTLTPYPAMILLTHYVFPLDPLSGPDTALMQIQAARSCTGSGYSTWTGSQRNVRGRQLAGSMILSLQILSAPGRGFH